MLNDKKASELITKSMRSNLSDDEQTAVEKHLKSSPDSQAFADISKAIQDSVSVADLTMTESDGGLSGEAKSRMQSSIRAAQLRMSSSDQPTSDPPSLVTTEFTQRSTKSRYNLMRKLGEGGLGTVWLARDEHLKRTVAVKEMNTLSLESPSAWQRFQREAEITGHLEHPNVVPLYQYGIDSATGQPFYAMRFVGKRTLGDAIAEHHERRVAGDADKMDLHRLLTAFIAACQAMAYAHSRGVIHRDLKPENVALDNFGQVIVLDWGLAKIEEDGELGTSLTRDSKLSDSSLAQTMEGEIVGTPLYMAPEQAAGDYESIDEKTDVYGLGAILFSILTGSAPHEKSNRTTDGQLHVTEFLRAIVDAPTPSPRDLNLEIPVDLATICQKAMAKKKYSRYQSACDLADAIDRWMAGQAEKQRRYDLIRLEGREIRANLESIVQDLGRTGRFMASMPPIQGIAEAHFGNPTEERSVWRQRLSTIFKGLLNASSSLSAVTYWSVLDDQMTEIVRVERHSTDLANIRAVPTSRLKSMSASPFINMVMAQYPDEVHLQLTEGCSVATAKCSWNLSAGTPVFCNSNEEPFGAVVIESDLDRLLESQIQKSVRTASDLLLVCPKAVICYHNSIGEGKNDLSFGKSCGELIGQFDEVAETLTTSTEYLDTTHHEKYAVRIELVPRIAAMTLMLLAESTSLEK